MTAETCHGGARVSAAPPLTTKTSDPVASAAIDAAIIEVCTALSVPLRLQILKAIMELGESSPTQLARVLETPLTTVGRNMRALNCLGVIELKRMVPRRGAVQHYYDLAPHMKVGLRVLLKMGGQRAAAASTGPLT